MIMAFVINQDYEFIPSSGWRHFSTTTSTPCRPLSRMQSPQFRAFVVAEEGKLSVPSRGESLVGWHGAAGIVKGQGIRNLLRFFVSVWLGTRAYFNINL